MREGEGERMRYHGDLRGRQTEERNGKREREREKDEITGALEEKKERVSERV